MSGVKDCYEGKWRKEGFYGRTRPLGKGDGNGRCEKV